MKAKRWTILEINGIAFELDNKVTMHNPIVFYKSVYDVYGRCSDTKKAIWEDWCKWFIQVNCHMYGVTSHNSNFFSIGAVVTYGSEEYYLEITAHHNRAYRITREKYAELV